LEAKGIDYMVLDGADQANRERRNELFGVSSQRGKYPQFFIVDGDDNGAIKFVGLWEQVEVGKD